MDHILQFTRKGPLQVITKKQVPIGIGIGIGIGDFPYRKME